MKVNIIGISHDYISDFDPVDIQSNVKRNWKVSAGDYFKFPVKLGAVSCFVKRFAKKKEEISGYEFLVSIKGVKLQGLPYVYDVVSSNEKGDEAIYLFTQYFQGETIDVLQRKGFTFLPIKLASDLFYALKNIHKYGYWFPDFDPKNFFRSSSGDFYIIDLDSTYPVSTLPRTAMYGSKDYWSPIFDFYRSTSGFTTEEIKTIKGDTLNMLQLVYFLSLYSFYIFGDGEDFTGVSLDQLNNYLTKTHKLFLSTMQHCFYRAPQSVIINQHPLQYPILSSFVNTCLFPQPEQQQYISNGPKKVQPGKPTGKFYVQDNKNALIKGGRYTLHWHIENSTLVLLDNLQVSAEGSMAFTAAQPLTHTLTAVNNSSSPAKTTSYSVSIVIDEKPEIRFSAAQTKIKEGRPLQLTWDVKNGSNINITQNKKVIATNCKTTGTLNVTPVLDTNKPGPQKFIYVLNASTTSGTQFYSSEPEISVTVEKMKSYTAAVVISVALLILIFFVFFKWDGCNSSYSSSTGSTSSDSSASMLTDSVGASVDTSFSNSAMTDTTAMSPLAADTTKMEVAGTEIESPYSFSDGFADNSNGWSLGSSAGVNKYLSDGDLMIHTIKESSGELSRLFPLDPYKDFMASTKVGWVQSSDSSTAYFGLTFCDNENTGVSYCYVIQPSGIYGIYEYRNDRWSTLASGYSSYIEQGSVYNRLMIKRLGNYIFFYVNDNIVKSLPYSMNAGNRFGIRSEGAETTVAFDDFSVEGIRQSYDDVKK